MITDRFSHTALTPLFLLALCCLFVLPLPAAHAALPSGVTSRLKKIDQYMTKVEDALKANRADHNNLDRAQSTLEEITKQYPDSANTEDVRAAEERIKKGAAAIEKLEKEQAAAKEQQDNDAKAKDTRAEEWANKLAIYKADTKDGAKGNFGVPMSDAARISALAPQYQEAKKLYADFLATGIDKESHWKLRQAVYDIKVALENYESSADRIVQASEKQVKDAREWQTAQKPLPAPNLLPTDRLQVIREAVAASRLLLPAESDRLKVLNADYASLEKIYTEVETIVLKNRRMKPDVYTGVDQETVKQLARSIVLKADAKAKVHCIHIINAAWTTESVEEWTDTTRTAKQFRVTRGINVQVALTLGSGCFLYTLFIHQDTIGGAKRPLTGHVMFTDKFLPANLPK